MKNLNSVTASISHCNSQAVPYLSKSNFTSRSRRTNSFNVTPFTVQRNSQSAPHASNSSVNKEMDNDLPLGNLVRNTVESSIWR